MTNNIDAPITVTMTCCNTHYVTVQDSMNHVCPVVEFRRVQAGYYILFVAGVERPVCVVRDGKTWTVQYADALRRNAELAVQLPGYRSLAEARLVALRVWNAISTARALAMHDAYVTTSASLFEPVAEAQAHKLNDECVYLEGRGTRAYQLTDVVRYDDGNLLFSVRPLSGGMEWTYDRMMFGTKPFTR